MPGASGIRQTQAEKSRGIDPHLGFFAVCHGKRRPGLRKTVFPVFSDGMKRMRRFLFCFVCGCGLFFIPACQTVPQTGRSALNLIPREQLASMSATQFSQMKQQTPISQNPKHNAMMQRVGERIADAASQDLPNADWEFVVFEDEQVNAFAMPGGKVAVYSGLFDIAETEDELAVVVGHEVAHVALRHGNERMSQQLLAAGGSMLLNVGTRDMESEERQLLMAAYGAGATVGYLLPHSRRHEAEADKIGLQYAARAGYDPRVAIDFWKNMSGGQRSGTPEFLSTHPSDATRMDRLKTYMPQAMLEYQRAKK